MDWKRVMPGADILFDEPMSRHTSFRVGGIADVLLLASSCEELALALRVANEEDLPVTVIGNGTNLLVRDGGIRGIVIKIDKKMSHISVRGDLITAQAGISLRRLAQEALAHSLKGLEFADGIPGTLGGAVCMNAGAYGGEMAQVVREVSGLSRDGTPIKYSGEMLGFGYRESSIKSDNTIVTHVTLALVPGDAAEIRGIMEDYASRRKASQPLDRPSAGSVFKRPEGYFAGKLIEDAGMKGTCVGGAQVSQKHAGFIINSGGATARDIETLIERVAGSVFQNSGVQLECEIRIIGEY